jgi:hypothetical protein
MPHVQGLSRRALLRLATASLAASGVACRRASESTAVGPGSSDPGHPGPSDPGYPHARRVYQAEAFWGITATPDQWNAPVTTAWTWIDHDTFQVPRLPVRSFASSIFLEDAAAATVATGVSIWQEVEATRSGPHRVFLRVLNYADGVNAIRVSLDGQSRDLSWGAEGLGRRPAVALSRLRRVHDLVEWLDAGTFTLPAGRHHLSIQSRRVGQPHLMLDAVCVSDRPDDVAPAGWNPRAARAQRPDRPVKHHRTLYSDDEIAQARENSRVHNWARELARRSLAFAQPYVECGDEALWRLVPSSLAPRSERVSGPTEGCPRHGRAIYAHAEPWRIDPFHHPCQVQCAEGGEWYPATPAWRDEPPEGSGGWDFAGHYRHQVHLHHVRPATEHLGRAYALTGDRRYARAAAILLFRLAQEYPDGFDKRNRATTGRYCYRSGTILNAYWSAGDLAPFARAWDLIFDAIDDDARLAGFLCSKEPTVHSGSDIRWFIEEKLLRTMGLAVLDGAIVANPGAHDSGLMAVALCLDDVGSGRFPDSRDMVAWLYYLQPPKLNDSWTSPRRYFSNVVLPDGCVDASVDYNSIILSFVECGERMERLRAGHPDVFPVDRYPSLLTHDRVRRHVDFLTDLVCLDRYHPAIGDGHGKQLWTGDNLRPAQIPRGMATMAYPFSMYALFRATGDPALARLLVEQRGFEHGDYHELFDRDRDHQIERLAREHPGPAQPASILLDDYAVVLLKSGRGDNGRVFWMNYGLYAGHRDLDYFNIGLFAHGLDVLPELPYPKSFPVRTQLDFEKHPLVHNTLTVDRGLPPFGNRHLTRFQEAGGWHVVTAVGSGPGLGTPARQPRWGPRLKTRGPREEAAPHSYEMERTCVLVDVDDERSYVVDFVHAIGGTEHHLSFHGPEAKRVTVSGVTLKTRPGTLGSETARYGDPVELPGGKTERHPFGFFTNVEQSAADRPYAIDYDFGDRDNVHLRIHGTGAAGAELLMADGRPPGDPQAYCLRYAFLHRAGASPLTSTFAHAIEPYEGRPVIDAVEAIAVRAVDGGPADAAGLRVHAGDRVDWFIANRSGARVRTDDGVETDGEFCAGSLRGGRLQSLLLSGGRILRVAGEVMFESPAARFVSEVVGVERAANAVVVRGFGLEPGRLAGQAIRIFNDKRSRMYVVIAAEAKGRDSVRLVLNRSSLYGEGEALGFEDGVVLNRVPLPNIGAGCTLETSSGQAWQVAGTGQVGHAGCDVLLVNPDGAKPGRDVLAGAFASPSFSVHGYGIGDRAEILNLVHAERGPGGWRVHAVGPVSHRP